MGSRLENATLPVGGRFMTRMKRLWRVGIVITSGSFRSLPPSPCSWIDNSVRFFPFNSVGALVGLMGIDGILGPKNVGIKPVSATVFPVIE